MEKPRRPHIVLCAGLGRGHTTPMVRLARLLASTWDATITVIVQNTAALKSINHELQRGLDIKFIALQEEGSEEPPWMVHVPMRVRGKATPVFEPTQVSFSIPHEFPELEQDLEQMLKQLLNSDLPPSCIINDFSLLWAAAPAARLCIPRYVLYTNPVGFMALSLHARELVAAGVFKSKDSLQVLGLPHLLPDDVSSFIWDPQNPFYRYNDCFLQQILNSEGVLVNTFYELEPDAINALREQQIRLFPVGPLCLQLDEHDLIDNNASVFPSSSSLKACMDWLDSKEPASVLYISFGSWEFLPDEQVRDLALGLLDSGSTFLWVGTVGPGSKFESILPEGFLEKISKDGTGLALSEWAPQNKILAHPSVGGFLTHCGWNSVTECISLAGVPMICWPFVGDQPITCRVLVDGLKIGVEVCEDQQGLVDRRQVQKLVEDLFSNNLTRTRANEFRELAKKAVTGSSKMALRSFMEEVSSK